MLDVNPQVLTTNPHIGAPVVVLKWLELWPHIGCLHASAKMCKVFETSYYIHASVKRCFFLKLVVVPSLL